MATAAAAGMVQSPITFHPIRMARSCRTSVATSAVRAVVQSSGGGSLSGRSYAIDAVGGAPHVRAQRRLDNTGANRCAWRVFGLWLTPRIGKVFIFGLGDRSAHAVHWKVLMRLYAGSTFTLQQVVTVAGVLTDAPQITFLWKEGLYGTENTITPTRASLGTYTVTFTPSVGGDLYYRWDTNGVLDVAQEGILSVKPSNFLSVALA